MKDQFGGELIDDSGSTDQFGGIPIDKEEVLPKKEAGDFARGAKEAFQQVPQLGYGLIAGAGAVAEKAVGEGGIATKIKEAGAEGYKRWGEKISEGAKESDSWTTSYERAKQGDYGSLVDWFQHGLGYAAGQGVQILATGGVGALAAKGAGIGASKIASGMVAKESARLKATEIGAALGTEELAKVATANVAAKIGQNTALATTALGMEGGEIYGDLVTEAQKTGRELSGAELGKAFVATIGAGGLEFAGDKLGLDLMLGKKVAGISGAGGRTARAAAAGTAGFVGEGATEYSQTLAEEWGKGKDPFSEESLRAALDAAALGALGGTAMGGVGGALTPIPKPSTTPDDILASPTADDAIENFTASLDDLALPATDLVEPTIEAPNVIPTAAANIQPDLRGQVPAGVEIPTPTGAIQGTEPELGRPAAMDNGLVAGTEEQRGVPESVPAQPVVGTGGETLTKEAQYAEAIRSDAGQIRQGREEGQQAIQRGPSEGGGYIQQPTPEKPGIEQAGRVVAQEKEVEQLQTPETVSAITGAQPSEIIKESEQPKAELSAITKPSEVEISTNAQGRITVKNVPREKLIAARDKLGIKGAIIGKDNAIFPKGTDIAALKNEFTPKPVEAAKIEAVAKPENEATYSTFKDGKMIRVAAKGVPPAMFGAKFEKQAREYYDGLSTASDTKAFAEEWSQKVKAESVIQPTEEIKPTEEPSKEPEIVKPEEAKRKAEIVIPPKSKSKKAQDAHYEIVDAIKVIKSRVKIGATTDINVREANATASDAKAKGLITEEELQNYYTAIKSAANQATARPSDLLSSAKNKKLEVLKAQAQGKITSDQGAALKELAEQGEHDAVDEILKPAKPEQPAKTAEPAISEKPEKLKQVEKPKEITQADIDKTGGILFSKSDKTPSLIIQHNLTEENLLHAERMGGIPIPSLAITQAEHPLTGFGEITLVGGIDMADPKGYAATKVFGADIYSPRYPAITYIPDTKALKKLNEYLAPYRVGREIYGSEISSVRDMMDVEAFRNYADSILGKNSLYGAREKLAVELLRKSGAEEKIFQGYTYTGKRRYIPHTLDNIVKILKKEIRGGEGFNYGVGSIRSKYTPQFRSIEQIRKAKDRLMTSKTFDEVKSEIDLEFEKVADEFREYHSIGNKFGFMDTMSSALYDAATMGLPKAFRENGFEDIPNEKFTLAAEFLNKLRTLPSEYFEAKILRAVDISEFKGAVVPDNVNQEVLDILANRGINNIATYKHGDDADRAAKIKKLATEAELLFSKSEESITNPHTISSATEAILNSHTGKIKEAIKAMLDAGKARVITSTQAANILGKDALFAKDKEGIPTIQIPDRKYKIGDLPRDMREELFNEHATNLNPEATERGFYAKSVPSGLIFIRDLKIDKIPADQLESIKSAKLADLPPIVISDGRLIDGQHRIQAAREKGYSQLRYIDVTGLIDTDAGGYISEIPEIYKATTDALFAKSEQTETPAFKAWFGDSKVVDENGNPLVVYHGTKGDFNTFDIKKAGISDYGLIGKAFYFTTTKEQGGDFATSIHYGKGDYPNVMPAFISLNNPAIIQDGILPNGLSLSDVYPSGITKHSSEALQKELKKSGYNGVIFKLGNEIEQVVAFRPDQIKSAIGNIGTFDPKNPDIRYSKEGGALAFYNLEDQVTYFIADNIPKDYSAESWRGLVRHELAIHALKMGKDTEEWNNMLSQFERRRKVDRKVKAAFERVPMDTPFEHVTEEAFAYYLQYRAIPKQEDDGLWHVYAIDDQEIGVFRTREAASAKAKSYNDAFAKNDSIFKKFITWFRNALREIGKRLPAMQKMRFMEWANSLNESDLIFMADEAIAGWTPAPKEEAGQIQPEGVMLSREEINRERYQRLVDKLKELYGGEDGYESLIVASDRYLRRYSDASHEYLGKLHAARKLKEGSETVRRRLLEQEDVTQGSRGAGEAAFATLESRGRLGNFDGYVTEASLQEIPGYGNFFSMEVWPAEFDGKDGALDVPVLTITINPTDDTRFTAEKPHGELVIYGPKYGSETFRILNERGWAEVAKGQDGKIAYLPDGSPWTRLTGATPAQLTALLSEAHARVRMATGAAHLGVNWERATGATGFATEGGSKEDSRKSAIYFARADSANPASWNAPEPSMFDDVVYKLQDKNIDLKRVVKAIMDSGETIQERYDPYRQEELFHGRSAKRVQDFVSKELKPLLTEMQARGLKLDEVDKYLHARHAKEANALIAIRDPEMPDGGSGMTNKEADDYFAKLPETQKKKLEATAKRVDAIITKTRDLYVSYGLISKEQADSWSQMFKHYVPLMREDHDGGMGVGQGFSVKGKEAKHRTGSTAAVVDIFANIAMQREKAIVRGEKNRVAVSLAGLAKLNPNEEFWGFGPVMERRYNENTETVEVKVKGNWKAADNVVIAKVKDTEGRVHELGIVFNERNERAVRMSESIKNLDSAQLNTALAISAVITRWFSSVNTQYNPIFGVTNLVRDVQGAALNLTSTPLAGKQKEVLSHILSAAKGIYLDARAERKGEPATSKWAALWDELQIEGGMTGYRDLYLTSEDRAKSIEKELDPYTWMNNKWGKAFTANGTLKVPIAKAQDIASPIFGWLSDYNTMMEGATRLSIYRTAIDNGLSKSEAASLAKNTTVNFNRKGQVGQQAGALYAFFNAAMQGTARIGQTMFDMDKGDIKTLRLSKTGKAIVAGGITLGSMQAMALAFAGFGDDEPPEFVRERNIIIPISEKKYITIPMPLGFHVLPNIGRISTEFVIEGFKDPAKRIINLLGVIIEAFNPIGSAGISLQTIMPTTIDPLIALAENRDWTGKPIYKEDLSSMRPTPGFTRNKDTAAAWSKAIAEGINFASGGTEYTPGKFSPTADQIDYLIGQVTGGVGRELSKIAQTGESFITGEELPTHKMPLAGRFYGDIEKQSSQGNKFYANMKEINLLDAELKGRREDRLPTKEFMLENPKYRLISQAKYADNIIGKLRKQKRDLIERDAPRESVRSIEERITREMLRFNQSVERMEAASNE